MTRADLLSQQWLKRVKILEKLKAEVPACICPDKTSTMADIGGVDTAIKMDDGQSVESVYEAHEDSDSASATEMDIEESCSDEMVGKTGESVCKGNTDAHEEPGSTSTPEMD